MTTEQKLSGNVWEKMFDKVWKKTAVLRTKRGCQPPMRARIKKLTSRSDQVPKLRKWATCKSQARAQKSKFWFQPISLSSVHRDASNEGADQGFRTKMQLLPGEVCTGSPNSELTSPALTVCGAKPEAAAIIPTCRR